MIRQFYFVVIKMLVKIKLQDISPEQKTKAMFTFLIIDFRIPQHSGILKNMKPNVYTLATF